MKRFITLIALLPLAVAADTVTFSWTPPTERVDGTPLPTEEIAGYTLEWSIKVQGQMVKQPSVNIPANTSYVLDTGTMSGMVCGQLRTVDTDGLVSDLSGEACRNSRPKAPDSLDAR